MPEDIVAVSHQECSDKLRGLPLHLYLYPCAHAFFHPVGTPPDDEVTFCAALAMLQSAMSAVVVMIMKRTTEASSFRSCIRISSYATPFDLNTPHAYCRSQSAENSDRKAASRSSSLLLGQYHGAQKISAAMGKSSKCGLGGESIAARLLDTAVQSKRNEE